MNIKNFFISLFWKQNKWHKHGVFIHTLRVVYYTFKGKEYRMIPAALLHDIGKPFVAYIREGEKDLSFTDHEEKSYQIIKNWPFISNYTKRLVRYHYLLRDMDVCKRKGNLERLTRKRIIYNSLSEDFKNDLSKFLIFDDKGKV